jgi:hypothetical protein
MEKYKSKGRKIGSYPCVTLGTDDDSLSGPKGDIWLHNPKVCKAVWVFRGQEKIHTFNIKDLAKWVSKLEVPHNPSAQLIWANNPNSRLKGL